MNNAPIVIYRNWLATFTALTPEKAGLLIQDLSTRILTGQPSELPAELVILSNQLFAEVESELNKYSAKCERNKKIAAEREAKKQAEKQNETTNVQRTLNERATNVQRTFGNSNTNSNSNSNSNSNITSVIDIEGVVSDETPKEPKKKKGRKSQNIPPELEEVKTYIKSKGYSHVDAEGFYSFYDSKGWFVGKSKMTCWESAVDGWERRTKQEKEQTISKDEQQRARLMAILEEPDEERGHTPW